MVVKVITTITKLDTDSFNFNIEFDDSELKDPAEKAIAEMIAAASLKEMSRLGRRDDDAEEDA